MLNYLKATYQVVRNMTPSEKTKLKWQLLLLFFLELLLYVMFFTEIYY